MPESDPFPVRSARIQNLKMPTLPYDPFILSAMIEADQKEAPNERVEEWLYFIREYKTRTAKLANVGKTKNRSFLVVATLVLYELGGFSLQELAVIFDSNVNTIKYRLKVARQIERDLQFEKEDGNA